MTTAEGDIFYCLREGARNYKKFAFVYLECQNYQTTFKIPIYILKELKCLVIEERKSRNQEKKIISYNHRISYTLLL